MKFIILTCVWLFENKSKVKIRLSWLLEKL